MANIDYIGNELELFKDAVNWKAYYKSAIDQYIHGDVCEVGAGIGGTTAALLNDKVLTWLAVEPDENLSSKIPEEIKGHDYAAKVTVLHGILDDIDIEKQFDAILYIDVIEHIESDKVEFQKAFERLRPGGNLIILVPAFNFLYNPFDKAIGHFRRYNKSMLRALAPDNNTDEVFLKYYDSMGFFASCANKFFINKSTPSKGNISMWDNLLVPFSKLVDPLLFRSFGKSLIGVWQKPN